ncbi:MAG: DNA polymerase ligase N-terminal domain-containing protein [Planctomycetaceae bacterium]
MSDECSTVSARSRFVILEHDHPFLHWDLLLEHGPVLHAWRILQPVTCEQWLTAERLEDHRLLYLDYEGPVSNDRGHVRRLTGGWYTKGAATDEAQQWFQLFDCSLATQAVLRTDVDQHPQWYFTLADSTSRNSPESL